MKNAWFLLFLNVLKISGFIWNNRIHLPMKVWPPVHKTPKQTGNFENIRGFYGLIGPHITVNNKTSLFDLFTGDGIIQGAFINNGAVTFVRHFVKTDKYVYEQKNGRIPENMFVKMFFMLMNKLHMAPNILGLANTAILNVQNKTYALYERDLPYEISVDFENQAIQTVGKTPIKSMSTFSAHSKFSKAGVETLDYNVLTNCVDYLLLNPALECLQKVSIKTRYLPVIHDFLATKQSVVLCDAPIILDFLGVFENILPVRFDIKQKTHFHVINKTSLLVETYTCDDAFYIFHYAQGSENEDEIAIYAPVYENLDFNQLNIHGKYRKLVLNKSRKTVSVERNPVLETMNLDFPVRYGERVLLRNIENSRIKELVLCEGLDIVHRFSFPDKFICGEPAVIGEGPNVVFFANDVRTGHGSLIILDLDTYEQIEMPTNTDNLSIGFHSTFMEAGNPGSLNNATCCKG